MEINSFYRSTCNQIYGDVIIIRKIDAGRIYFEVVINKCNCGYNKTDGLCRADIGSIFCQCLSKIEIKNIQIL